MNDTTLTTPDSSQNTLTYTTSFPRTDAAASPDDGIVTFTVDPNTAATALPWEEPGPSHKRSPKKKQQAKARRKQAKASRRRNR